MIRKTSALALFATLAILVVVEPASAQRRGGRGWGGGNNGGWDGGHNGGWSGFSLSTPYISGGYYSGNGYYGHNYGGGPYYGSYGSGYYGGSYYPYSSLSNRGWYGNSSSYYSYGSPSYYEGTYNNAYNGSYQQPMYSYPTYSESYTTPGQITSSFQTMPSSSSFASVGQQGITSQSFYGGPTTASDKAQFQVMLPSADAKLWIDDKATQQSGTDRFFESPSLSSGTYTYTVKATWTENGKEVTRTKKVDFQPGQNVMVDLRTADSEQLKAMPNPRQ